MAPEPSSNTKLSDRVGWGVSSPHHSPHTEAGGMRERRKDSVLIGCLGKVGGVLEMPGKMDRGLWEPRDTDSVL